MTSLLVLAQELLERAANPAYGVAINDEHAARLAAAIGPEDVERFASEVSRLNDPANLTSYGWAWMLEFAIGHGVALDRKLLSDLCQRWDDPALKALVIEAAIDLDDAGDSDSDDNERLSEVVERAAPRLSPPDDGRVFDDGSDSVNELDDDQIRSVDDIDISSAEALITALLIVGTGAAVAAARALTSRQWPGFEQLNEFVASHVNDPDPLARAPWEMLRRR